LANELLFGRLVDGGKVTVDIDDEDKIKLEFHTDSAKSGGLNSPAETDA
jgi:ATP-dependent Clp protease ATP-binding subunit ClpA